MREVFTTMECLSLPSIVNSMVKLTGGCEFNVVIGKSEEESENSKQSEKSLVWVEG